MTTHPIPEPERLHFVRVAERIRGTDANPVREFPARSYVHEEVQSPVSIVRDLVDDARDWHLYELRGSGDHWWPLYSRQQREALIAELTAPAMPDAVSPFRHGWTPREMARYAPGNGATEYREMWAELGKRVHVVEDLARPQ